MASEALAYPAEDMTPATEERAVDSSFSPRAGTSRLHQTVPTDASPDSKCPICLDRFDNVAYLDRCLHRFCFRCVQEWSKNKAECPLCKQPFHSIIHTVRAEDDFKEYILKPSENGSFASPNGRRFRYRTTVTREHRTTSSQRSSSSRRTLSPPDNGILFEAFSSQPVQQRDVGIQQMIRKLASRRQASAEGRSLRQIQEQEIINFRRALYRSGVRIRSVQDGGRYREISAEFFRRNPACLHRLVPWLKRELTVLFGAHGSLVNIVQHIIMSNVTRYDLGSKAFADDLKPFLLHRTDHFLHEFISFARCPFNIEAYDQHANYDCPAPSYDEGSHSESSIITISPDEADSQEPDHNASTTGTDQAPWDDETPGPSYSSSEQVHAAVASDTSESSDEEPARNGSDAQGQSQANTEPNDISDASSENCVIVGYVKPLAERTPELVELSSDSEESVAEEKSENVKKPQPIQFHSFSDSEASGCSSLHSPVSKDNKSICKGSMSPLIKTAEVEKSEEDKIKIRDASTWDSLQGSSTRKNSVCSPCNHRLSRKRRSRSSESSSQHSHSRDRHSHRSKRKHRSKESLKNRLPRSRDSSGHRSKRNRRRSRTRDTSLSRKSLTLSLSSESTISRGVSRSRSRSNGHSKRRSRSRESDHYYIRENYQNRYQWGYTFYSRHMDRDGYESSYRRRAQARAHYSRQSASPEYRIQSFSERTNTRNQRGHNESRYYCYERRRSRSRSSNRSRTTSGGTDRMRCEKPGGKRKYKTRHLESVHKEKAPSPSKGEGNGHQKPMSKYSGCYQNENSPQENQASNETKHRKRKKKIRSPSVEIVYEGKATDTTRHHKKKKKKHKKKHRRHHTGNSAPPSPVVITIDSDSDKEVGIRETVECDSSVSWTTITQLNERENESPSSLLDTSNHKDVYAVTGETAISNKDRCITNSRKDLADDIGNVDLRLQKISDEQTPAVAVSSSSSSCSSSCSSSSTLGIETLPINVETAQMEASSHLPSPRTSFVDNSGRPPLILRLPKKLIDRSYWLDTAEKKM
ncbi:E3 ubiquitin-protein ligase Topors isoform X2 [Alligator sinensis]|uniref:E3 ubiquitin-protein ligase Topors n=1 Tax=Alligator sinensis TaxID=38654 RepID=A0A1U7RKG3_ALLSI|nr:E3 ubiquitin-protein ligase Topors isoform X2 [Alligator sinensis]